MQSTANEYITLHIYHVSSVKLLLIIIVSEGHDWSGQKEIATPFKYTAGQGEASVKKLFSSPNFNTQ